MANISSVVYASLGLGVFVYFLIHSKLQKRSTLRYPPGPKVTTMPAQDAWIQYRSWGKEYGQCKSEIKMLWLLYRSSQAGELVYFQDGNILIINDHRVATDLLEKRARIYSDRRMPIMMKLCVCIYRSGSDTERIFQDVVEISILDLW